MECTYKMKYNNAASQCNWMDIIIGTSEFQINSKYKTQTILQKSRQFRSLKYKILNTKSKMCRLMLLEILEKSNNKKGGKHRLMLQRWKSVT